MSGDYVGGTLVRVEQDLAEIHDSADEQVSARPRVEFVRDDPPDWREVLVVTGLHGGCRLDKHLLGERAPQQRHDS